MRLKNGRSRRVHESEMSSKLGTSRGLGDVYQTLRRTRINNGLRVPSPIQGNLHRTQSLHVV